MSQLKQTQKVKLFHILKVVFYLLGLPLFFVAVFFTAIKFIGVEPFVGLSTSTFNSGVFVGYERFITSPALYGIWCAFAIWAFITICHFVLAKFVKNGKLRMFAVIALILVVMLGTMGIMDAAFESQIGKIADGAPTGVTVQDYKAQLSYYDYVSYWRQDKSLINNLAKRVAQYEDVYNIKYQGVNKSGDAGNIANKPVTYANVIDNDGKVGATPAEGKIADSIIEVAPNNDGKLVIGGKVYDNYFYLTRKGGTGKEVNVWYDIALLPQGYKWNAKKGKITVELQDGIYGEGLYNESGLLSDGWIFSLENVLNILEDYYEGQNYLSGVDAAKVNKIREDAAELRRQYYEEGKELPTFGKVDTHIKALYDQEVIFANNFSMPQGRLEEVVSYLGAMLGDNNLFDWLLNGQGGEFVSGILGMINGNLSNLISDLKSGVALKTLLGSFVSLDEGTQGKITNILRDAFDDQSINDVCIKLVYPTNGHLSIQLYKDSTSGTLLKTVEFTDEMTEPDENENSTYKFNLSKLSAFLNKALDSAVNEFGLGGILNTVGGLVFNETTYNGAPYYGLDLLGTNLPLIKLTKDAEGKITAMNFDIDLTAILTNIVGTLYHYQSPAIKPVWEFYTEVAKVQGDQVDDEMLEIATYLANYERAYYEATVQGKLMGSALIGDTLGAGTYPAALGLTDLASVQQLKTDLSYQPKNFPLYAFRDMLLTFAGIVMFFYFLSFVAAEKERKYLALANGETVETEGAEAPAEKPVFGGKLGKALTASDKKTSLGRKIAMGVLYALAFLPLLIIGIVIAAKSSAILPSYGAMHFIGFIILLVFALIYAVVVVLLLRKQSKSSATSKTLRIGITYICLTAVFALILTYVLPDVVANATSSTLWVEDMYNDPIAQVEENASLEHDFIMYNLLNGNLNKYETKDGKTEVVEDFSYVGLKARSKKAKDEVKEILDGYKSNKECNTAPKMREYVENLKTSDPTKYDLYNFIYQYYVLSDFDYAFIPTQARERHALALTIADYLYAHAGYEALLKEGFGNAKVKQLFDNNYDSFNQDGYKTFDDPLLLFAQLDGRMTTSVIVGLILNQGWTYTQPTYDAQGKLVGFDESNTFLYEMYDPEALAAYKTAGGKFDDEHKETLIDGDGNKYEVRYGVNDEGWKVYENGVVRRPLNWLVLDMLGDPMALASIDLSTLKIGDDLTITSLLEMLPSSGIFDTLDGLLNEDVFALVNRLTDGAGLRVGIYIDDFNQLQIQLLPMNATYGMLGYMQATWVQSNGLLMAVINLMALRNYLYIFAGIGLFLILIAGVLVDIEKKHGYDKSAEQSDPETSEPETFAAEA